MKKRYWIIGLAAAVVAAFAVKKAVDNKQLSAEEALEITRRTFSAKGRVQGAWISATPEAYAYESRDYQSYKGGISVLEGDDEKTYQFTVDAETGALLEYA